MMRARLLVAVAFTAFTACGDSPQGSVDGSPDAPPGAVDGGGDLPDAPGADAPVPDAALPDAVPPDAMPPDATPTFQLTVEVGEGGTVTSDVGAIDCTSLGGVCADSYPSQTVVTLTATPDADYAFDGWSGDCAGIDAQVAVTVDANESCRADFSGTQGDVAIVPPPVTVVPQQNEDSDNILVFQEQADLTLAQEVPYDLHVPSTYAQTETNPGTVPAGTRINSYFLHFDPVGTGTVNKIGSVTFPNPIIGLVVKLPTLETTDTLLGLGTVTYPTAGTHPARDIELSTNDAFTLSADRRTLSVDFRTSTSVDHIRIITVAPGEAMPAREFNVSRISPPPSVEDNQSEAAGAVQLFPEMAGVTLAADLMLDIDAPGYYTGSGQVTGGVIASGTTVKSYLLHFDPPSSETVLTSLDFGEPILGLIVLGTNLDASDPILGASGTTYGAGGTMELSDDHLRFGTDRQSMAIRFKAGSGIDQVRVILAD